MIYFNDQPIAIKNFPNGESLLEKDFFSKYRKESNAVTLKYESDADLFQLLLVRKALWFPCDLHITYFPYSRMDRKSESFVFTLKSVAKFINWLDFATIHIYEPHSDVTPALLNHCKIHSVTPELLRKTDFNLETDVVYYPDAGAHKKYGDLIKTDNYMVGIKHRDFATGKLTEPIITGTDSAIRSQENWAFADKRIFIVDDLCSKGGTFIMAARLLKQMQAKEINLVVAHCEKSIFDGDILKTDNINKVFTTDSIIQKTDENEKLKIYSLLSL